MPPAARESVVVILAGLALLVPGAADDEAIVDVLAGGAGAFRSRLEAPGGTVLFDGLSVDRTGT
jgi:hypothetical protein